MHIEPPKNLVNVKCPKKMSKKSEGHHKIQLKEIENEKIGIENIKSHGKIK